MADQQWAEKSARMLQAIAEPTRIRILDCLRTGPKSVTELATALGTEIVNISHHLAVMRAAKILVQEKRGRFVIYSLNPDLVSHSDSHSTLLELGLCMVEMQSH